MQYIVQDAKYRTETISAIISFANVFSSGEVISGTPAITVSVLSGVDPTPSNMLYEGITITNGNTIEQRFRLGELGCIYEIVYEVVTSIGNTFSKNFYLAILPNGDAAIPTWIPLWETTQLYPIEPSPESYQASFSIQPGDLITIVIPYQYGPESYQTLFTLSSGTLSSVVVPYSYSYEAYQTSFTTSGGTLVVVVVPYDYSYESYTTSFSIDIGTLQQVVISYSYSYEAYQTSLSFSGGSLT